MKGDRPIAGMARPAQRMREALPRNETPIVPPDTSGGRALVAVVAIMTFLACLTAGAVLLIRASASDWQSEVSREVTIQVRPSPGRLLDEEVQKAVDAARAFPGIAEVRPFSRDESARLLEPWLGSGLTLEDLPIPRVIVVRLAAGQEADLNGLRRVLSDRVPGATLDDHRGWIERMRAMTSAAVIGGAFVLALVLAATVLSVTFATRGAIAANMPVIEVLHLIGARDSFIAGQFQGHFLRLGLKGGALGGGSAILVFLTASFLSGWIAPGPGSDQAAPLFGSFSLGLSGYLILLLQVFVAAAVTAAASRHTVYRMLEAV